MLSGSLLNDKLYGRKSAGVYILMQQIYFAEIVFITDYPLLITHNSSPDSNGYPATYEREFEGWSVGVCWREEYEWIAGKSSF